MNGLAAGFQRQVYTLVLACLLPALQAAPVMADIAFDSAAIEVRDSQHNLQAMARVELNATIEAGLQSGVPLHFNADVAIKKVRTWWWDKTVARYRRTYVLVYYELTRHYRISVVGEDVIRNFRSLLDALDFLGEIREMPLEPFVNFNQRRKYYAQIRLSLDVGALPLPLQPQTLVSSAWRLSSEEYQWPIN